VRGDRQTSKRCDISLLVRPPEGGCVAALVSYQAQVSVDGPLEVVDQDVTAAGKADQGEAGIACFATFVAKT
jgi:hypothetical protein